MSHYHHALLSLVPVRITNPEVIHPNQYLMSNVDPLFEVQYPDVAAIPLMHHTTTKNQQELAVCLVNPGEWEVTLPKEKTVQQISPLTGQVQINCIIVEQNEVHSTTDSVHSPKNTDAQTGVVMPGDYSPHQEYELEDAKVAPEQLEELIQKYDCIISKHSNDINMIPLLKIEIETEGPPIASQPYALPLKYHSFVRNETANLERSGVIQKKYLALMLVLS